MSTDSQGRIAIVVGGGNIGRRHAQLLRDAGFCVTIVSRRPMEGETWFQTIDNACAALDPEIVVIANETSAHLSVLKKLADLRQPMTVLIEKPLCVSNETIPDTKELTIFVGYNLRFHAVLNALEKRLEGEDILHADIRCESYLPDWRPNRDYKTTSSADRKLGGGVLHDLSHELDYAIRLFGDWKKLTAHGRNTGRLDIDADEFVDIAMETNRGIAVSIHLDYFSRRARRTVSVTTQTQTFDGDLLSGMLASSKHGMLIEAGPGFEDTYDKQLSALIDKDDSHLCSLEEAIKVQGIICAAETAMRQNSWISR